MTGIWTYIELCIIKAQWVLFFMYFEKFGEEG